MSTVLLQRLFTMIVHAIREFGIRKDTTTIWESSRGEWVIPFRPTFTQGGRPLLISNGEICIYIMNHNWISVHFPGWFHWDCVCSTTVWTAKGIHSFRSVFFSAWLQTAFTCWLTLARIHVHVCHSRAHAHKPILAPGKSMDTAQLLLLTRFLIPRRTSLSLLSYAFAVNLCLCCCFLRNYGRLLITRSFPCSTKEELLGAVPHLLCCGGETWRKKTSSRPEKCPWLLEFIHPAHPLTLLLLVWNSKRRSVKYYRLYLLKVMMRLKYSCKLYSVSLHSSFPEASPLPCKASVVAGGEGVIRRVACQTSQARDWMIISAAAISLPLCLSFCLQQERVLPVNTAACTYKSVSTALTKERRLFVF